MIFPGRFALNFLLLFFIFVAASLTAATVTLTAPTAVSPQPVGTALQWSVGFTDIPGTVEYSWIVTTPDGLTSVVSDYETETKFTYMPLQDGVYTITVRAKDTSTLTEQAEASLPYTASSLITGTSPTITATSNPFVVIYSAPCAAGNIRVFFWSGRSHDKVGHARQTMHRRTQRQCTCGGHDREYQLHISASDCQWISTSKWTGAELHYRAATCIRFSNSGNFWNNYGSGTDPAIFHDRCKR